MKLFVTQPRFRRTTLTENKVENEFGSAPILNNVQLGSYTFSAEVADMQAVLLEKLCGYKKGEQILIELLLLLLTLPVYAEIAFLV